MRFENFIVIVWDRVDEPPGVLEKLCDEEHGLFDPSEWEPSTIAHEVTKQQKKIPCMQLFDQFIFVGECGSCSDWKPLKLLFFASFKQCVFGVVFYFP
eukprot:m.212122 g.212122  ORF g.212122 m.212122 type:complete len:98 (-) comp13787_c0_seq8:2619-2912(-)